MFPFLKKIFPQKADRPDAPVVIFDFGSRSVKLLLCRYRNEKVEVLAGRKVVYPQNAVDDDELVDPAAIQPLLLESLAQLFEKKNLPHPISAVVGIGGLGVSGYTSQIVYRRAKIQKTISDPEFKTILTRVEERAGQVMKKLIAWETASGNEPALINSEVLELTVDGYAVAAPIGSSGEKLSFTIYNAYTPGANHRRIVALLSQLNCKVLSMSSSMYATLRSVMAARAEGLNALVIDIGANATEVGIIKEGRIIGHAGFEVAGDSFSSSIASGLGKDPALGEELKLGYSAAKLPEEVQKEIRELVGFDCKVFFSGVKLLLEEFPGYSGMPEQVFLAGGGSLLPGVVSYLQAAMGQERADLKVDSVKALLPVDLRSFVDRTGRINSSADIAPLSVALDAADLLEEE
ncbi:MAG: rod shape-determining protein [Candidatus Doudnabacteria bacterium]|nr:rod shape-determining protein [Candidatus Doudnabacteria bacterium]